MQDIHRCRWMSTIGASKQLFTGQKLSNETLSNHTMVLETIKQYGSGTLSGNSLSVFRSDTLDVMRLDDDLVWPIASIHSPRNLLFVRHTETKLLMEALRLGRVNEDAVNRYFELHHESQDNLSSPQHELKEFETEPLIITGNRFGWTEMLANTLLVAFLRQGRSVILLDTRETVDSPNGVDYHAFEFNYLKGSVTKFLYSDIGRIESAFHPASVLLVNVDYSTSDPNKVEPLEPVQMPPGLPCKASFSVYIHPVGVKTLSHQINSEAIKANPYKDGSPTSVSFAWTSSELSCAHQFIRVPSPNINLRANGSSAGAQSISSKNIIERIQMCGGLPQRIFDDQFLKLSVFNSLRESLSSSIVSAADQVLAQGPSRLASFMGVKSAKDMMKIHDPHFFRLAILDRLPSERALISESQSLQQRRKWLSSSTGKNYFDKGYQSTQHNAADTALSLDTLKKGLKLDSIKASDIVLLDFDSQHLDTILKDISRDSIHIQSSRAFLKPSEHSLLSLPFTGNPDIDQKDVYIPVPDTVMRNDCPESIDLASQHSSFLLNVELKKGYIRLISQDITETAMNQWRFVRKTSLQRNNRLSEADSNALLEILEQDSDIDPVAFRPLFLEHQFLCSITGMMDTRPNLLARGNGGSPAQSLRVQNSSGLKRLASVRQLIPSSAPRSRRAHSFSLQIPSGCKLLSLKSPVSRNPKPVRESLISSHFPVFLKPLVRNHYCYDLLYIEPAAYASLPPHARPKNGDKIRSNEATLSGGNSSKPTIYAFKFLPSLRVQTHVIWKRLLEDLAAIEYGSYSIKPSREFIDMGLKQLDSIDDSSPYAYLDWDKLPSWFTFRYVFVTDADSSIAFSPLAAAGVMNINEVLDNEEQALSNLGLNRNNGDEYSNTDDEFMFI